MRKCSDGHVSKVQVVLSVESVMNWDVWTNLLVAAGFLGHFNGYATPFQDT